MATDIRVKGGMPAGFRVVGPVYKTEMHMDGTIIRKTDHRNGVVDVITELPDGSIVQSVKIGAQHG